MNHKFKIGDLVEDVNFYGPTLGIVLQLFDTLEFKEYGPRYEIYWASHKIKNHSSENVLRKIL